MDQVSGKKRMESDKPSESGKWKTWSFSTRNLSVSDVLYAISTNINDRWFVVTSVDEAKGLVSFPNGRQVSAIKKMLDWNVEQLSDPFMTAVRRYSQMPGEKSEQNVGILDVITAPIRPLSQIKEEQFYAYQQKAYALFKGEPDGRSVHWFHEREGNIGKSAFVTFLYDNHPSEVVIFDKGKFEDLAFAITSQDMGPVRAVIWDIPRQTKGHISTAAVECVLNGRMRSTKYQGDFIRFPVPHIICFSNFLPTFDSNEFSADRIKIYDIIDKDVDMANPQSMPTFSSTSRPI